MTNGSAYVLFLPTDATVKTIFEIFLFLPFFIEKKKKKKKKKKTRMYGFCGVLITARARYNDTRMTVLKDDTLNRAMWAGQIMLEILCGFLLVVNDISR